MDDYVEIIKFLSEFNFSDKEGLKINFKFLRPLASEYSLNIFGKIIPEISHGCGAGINFIFMNNKGEIYPCNKLVANLETQKNFINNKIDDKSNFRLTWEKEEFNIPFSIMESKEYENLYPCNVCKFFKKICFPCPVAVKEKNATKISECEFYINAILDKKIENIINIKAILRYADKGNGMWTLLNTFSQKMVTVNVEVIEILNKILNKEILNFSSLVKYGKIKEISIVDIIRLIEFLEKNIL